MPVKKPRTMRKAYSSSTLLSNEDGDITLMKSYLPFGEAISGAGGETGLVDRVCY